MSRQRIDYGGRDAEALTQALLDVARERLPAWTDHSDNDLGIVLLQAFAYLGDQLFYHLDRTASESYLETASEPRSVVHLLRLIGYELEPSKPSSVNLELIFAPDTPRLPKPKIEKYTEFHTTRETAGRVVRFRFTGEPLEIDLPTDIDEADGMLHWRSLPVRQVERIVEQKVVGSSDDSSGQRFLLPDALVIDDTLKVWVAGVEWERVDTLLFSGPPDRHYQVRRDENERAWIEFGTGTQGQIPIRGVDNIRADYLVGGGAHGNVAPNTIIKLGERAGGVRGLKASAHASEASGGSDREPLEVGRQRGPLQFRSQDRAVTATDYEAHALELGVAKARAFTGAWNRVQIYVAPAGGGLPSDVLREQLLRHLDRKRVMTTIVEIHPPAYVDVDVEADLVVEPTYFTQQVQQTAEDAIRALLHFDRVDFGVPLYVSKLYEAVEAIDGVRAVTILRFEKRDVPVDPTAPPNIGVLPFAPAEIPVLGRLVWREVTGGQRNG